MIKNLSLPFLSKVIIPLSVLDKLSNFKSNAGILGDSADT